jgi:drug/metabolite transporter (DMT)-like permease
LVLNAATVGSITYLALLGSAFAFWALFWLLRRISVTRLSLITYVTPVVALVLGATLAHEILAPQTYAGIALVGAGVWLMHAKFGAAAKIAEEAG